jgi:hypothetical protein
MNVPKLSDGKRVAGMSVVGPTQTVGDVRFRAAVKGIADIKRAPIRSAPIEYTRYLGS